LQSPPFEDATTFSERLAAVDIGGKYGYIDTSGKLIIPPQFRDTYAFSEGIARVSTSDGSRYITKKLPNNRLFQHYPAV
jgi:hypothetical protein